VKILTVVTYPNVRMPVRRPPSIPALASSTTILLSAATPTREAANRYTSGSGLPGVHLQPIQCSEKCGSLTRPPAQHQCLRGAPLKRLLVAIHACAACATALQPRVRVQCRSGSPNDDIVLLFACAIRSICSALAAEPSQEEIIESLHWPNVERNCSRAMTDAFVRHRDSPGNPVEFP
jgi:hypothetical protein